MTCSWLITPRWVSRSSSPPAELPRTICGSARGNITVKVGQHGTSIGIDIGGTKTAAGLCRDGVVLERAELPTPADSLDGLLKVVHDLTDPWLADAGSVGACAPGWHDPRSGRISLAANIPALTGVDLTHTLEDLLGRSVAVGNDADAAALAEFRIGAAREWDSVFYATISTGIGGGHVSSQGILSGHAGAAAEIGHMIVRPGGRLCTCSARGCLEAYASGKSLARHASLLSGRDLSSAEVLEMWRSADPLATDVVAEAASALAVGLAIISQILDPQGLVLGGGVVIGNPDLVEYVMDELAELMGERRVPEVRLAELGADAGMLGASLLPQVQA